MLLGSLEQLPERLPIAGRKGLTACIQDADSFVRRNCVLLLVDTATQTNVGISLGLLPFEVEAVERTIVSQRSPAINWAHVATWVSQFAEVLESPELWTDIERLRR